MTCGGVFDDSAGNSVSPHLLTACANLADEVKRQLQKLDERALEGRLFPTATVTARDVRPVTPSSLATSLMVPHSLSLSADR